MTELKNDQPTTRAARLKRTARRWLFEGLVVLLILAAVGWWQGRTLASGIAPTLYSSTLADSPLDLTPDDKPTLVYFWATWCPVCNLTGDAIDSVARDHRIITIAMQSGTEADVRAHLHEKGIDFPVLIDEDGAIAARWGVRGVPTSFILDGSDQIRFTTVGLTSAWGLRLRLWLTSLI